MVARSLIPQPVHDAIGAWIFSSTDCRPWRAESNLPRPALPYVGFEVRSLGALTSPSEDDFEASLASAVFTITAAEEEFTTVIVNSARASFERLPAELIEDFALRLRDRINSVGKGRVTCTAVDDVLTVLPVAPGDLMNAQAIEGADLVLDDEGPPYCASENVYRFEVSVQLHGLPYGAPGGTLGDGKDLQTALVALRESLSRMPTKQSFADVWTRIVNAPGVLITVGSATSNGQKETRGTLLLTIGVTIRTCSPSQASTGVILPAQQPVLQISDEQPIPQLVIE